MKRCPYSFFFFKKNQDAKHVFFCFTRPISAKRYFNHHTLKAVTPNAYVIYLKPSVIQSAIYNL